MKVIQVKPIDSVGIAPTYEQIETFSFHLPQVRGRGGVGSGIIDYFILHPKIMH